MTETALIAHSTLVNQSRVKVSVKVRVRVRVSINPYRDLFN